MSYIRDLTVTSTHLTCCLISTKPLSYTMTYHQSDTQVQSVVFRQKLLNFRSLVMVLNGKSVDIVAGVTLQVYPRFLPTLFQNWNSRTFQGLSNMVSTGLQEKKSSTFQGLFQGHFRCFQGHFHCHSRRIAVKKIQGNSTKSWISM